MVLFLEGEWPWGVNAQAEERKAKIIKKKKKQWETCTQ
jgi:hypothetical protein